MILIFNRIAHKLFKGNRGAKNCFKFCHNFSQMLLFVTIFKVKFKWKSQFRANLCAAHFFCFHRPNGDFWGISSSDNFRHISESDTRLCGKIKFKRLQTKRTIAEKLGTGKSTDTVHSTVLRKNYRLVLNQFKFKFQI